MLRPLLSLLAIDRSAFEGFESLLALTNVTSSSRDRDDEVRTRLIHESGAFGAIEHYLFETDHEMLRRAATECICNLVLNEEVRFMEYILAKSLNDKRILFQILLTNFQTS